MEKGFMSYPEFSCAGFCDRDRDRDRDRNRNRNRDCDCDCDRDRGRDRDCEKEKQTHVHEILGSTEIAEKCDPHNHRFATVSNEVIPMGNDHVHEVKFRTDFYEDHFHEFCGRTGGAISVGGGRHVHFIESVTQVSDGHRHQFKAASLINDPIGD